MESRDLTRPDPARSLKVLLVDDDETFRRVFGNALVEKGFNVERVGDGQAALDLMNHATFDVALVDLRMPQMDGISLLAEMQRRHPETVAVVLTGFGSVPNVVESMRKGAFDVVSKTASLDQVVAAIEGAHQERVRLRAGTALAEALAEHTAFFGIVGRSPAMRRVYETIERFKDADQPVLICGESGTGKELVARALHAAGRRRNGPLIAVNCASLRENFVENELFGHVRGAFTGAQVAKKGLVVLADGGTLHIDEIAEMSESAQAALLRFLDSGVFRPLGSTREERVETRVIASTNRDLDRAVEEGGFRRDLFFRLCVCRIDLPPLRQRRDDIPLLVNFFLDVSSNVRRRHAKVTDAALEILMQNGWPGNVRELLNTLERAVLLAQDGVVKPEHVGVRAGMESLPSAASPDGGKTRHPTLDDLERSYILDLLGQTGGNITEMSRILGIDPTTLRRKLRRWGDR